MKTVLRYLLLLSSIALGMFIGKYYYSCPRTQYGKLIILHGISSSGKTSTAKALQNLFAQDNQPYIYIPMDNFLGMLPKRWLNFNPFDTSITSAPDALQFIEHHKPGETVPHIEVIIGPVVTNIAHGMMHTLVTMAHYGNNVIFDGAFPNYFLEDVTPMKKCMPLFIIGIKTSLEMAEERERKRNGRIGLSRSQYNDPDYSYDKYDLIVDTTSKTPVEAAQQIKEFIETSSR